MEKTFLTLTELCITCGVEQEYIIEMVEMGILQPQGGTINRWQFSLFEIPRLQKAQRLQNDLKLNLAGVALSLELLDEMKALRNHIQDLEHQLKLLSQL